MGAQDSGSLHGQSASCDGQLLLLYGGSDADGGAASADVSSSYLYNLNLQQSLLSSLNLSALSPGQLALLQQQMQRLSSPSLGVDDQQKQLASFQQQQHSLLLQQQQLQQLQGQNYSRMAYPPPNAHRGYRQGNGVDRPTCAAARAATATIRRPGPRSGRPRVRAVSAALQPQVLLLRQREGTPGRRVPRAGQPGGRVWERHVRAVRDERQRGR